MKVDFHFPTFSSTYDDISRIRCADTEGSLTILERHIDYVTALATGIVELVGPDGSAWSVGIDDGILVKRGGQVQIAALRGVEGGGDEPLWNRLQEKVIQQTENAKKVSTILARLEMDVARHFFTGEV
jgi:F-type H+-transporting ATPase subunit epsilon